MPNDLNLARLTNLEVRLYRLETKSHLRIGAGEGSADLAAADLPIIRALLVTEAGEKRVPYIPASSLHGVIRAWVEKAKRSRTTALPAAQLRQLAPPGGEAFKQAEAEVKAFLGLRPEDPLQEADVYEHWQVYSTVCNPLLDVDKCERISGRESESRRWKVNFLQAAGRTTPCEVCQVFGYMGQRGRVKISNAFPATEQTPVDIITRVAINRLTGAADEGKLFNLEAIPPGCVFYFFVIMENMSAAHKQDFEFGIRAINLQLASLGAHSTVGFGMVELAQVLTADIKPAIFDQTLETILPTLLASADYRPRNDLHLDEEKYPQFFRALARVHTATGQPPVEQFGGQITFV